MSKGKPVAYSEMEQKLYNLLKKGKKFTLSQLSERVYKDDDAPLYHRESVYACLHRLEKKTKFNRDTPRTLRSDCDKKRLGPREATYWME